MLTGVRSEQRSTHLQIGKRRGTARADQVVSLQVGTQTQAFDHVPGQPRAQVASASADDDGVDAIETLAALMSGSAQNQVSHQYMLWPVKVATPGSGPNWSNAAGRRNRVSP